MNLGKYVLVSWPESQDYIGKEGVVLCVDDEIAGCSALFIPEEMYEQDIDNSISDNPYEQAKQEVEDELEYKKIAMDTADYNAETIYDKACNDLEVLYDTDN